MSQGGKRKGQKGVGVKKKNNKNKTSVHRKAGRKCNQIYAGNDLVQKLFLTMEKHREVFFVVRLHSCQMVASLLPINDPDPHVVNDLMDGRDNFLMMAREKHYEFSSLRRAKFSTMAMLYELHTQGRDNFVYTCNNCKANIETHYHCNTCDDFDLCLPCYRKGDHQHPMEKRGLDLDEGSAEGEDRQLSPVESRRQSIQRCIQSLCHASQCRDANCHTSSCVKMKRVIQHTFLCHRRTNSNCPVCKQLIALCCYHAKNCTESKCSVPFCLQIRHKLHQQQLQTRFRQSQMERRRMALMTLHNPSSAAAAAAADHHRTPLPFAQSGIATAKSSAESISTSDKLTPSAAAAAVAVQQVDGSAFSTKADPFIGQTSYVVNKPALIQVQDSTGVEQVDPWKSLALPNGQAVASLSAGDLVPVATATASNGTALAASTPSASSVQQRLLFQKLVAAVKSSQGAEQQQLLKMMARTNPQLLSSFIKQMYANNRKRLELAAGGVNPQTPNQAQSVDIATTGQEAASSQVTIQLMPTQSSENAAGVGPVQAVIGIAPTQQRTLGVASLSPRIAIANGNRLNVATEQTRLSFQPPFPQHLLQQLSLQQQQLQRTGAAASSASIQSPRLRINPNILRPSQVTEIASGALSQQQQSPVVMVTLTQAGNARLPGMSVGSYPVQSAGNIIVGQSLAMLHGLHSPLMTTNASSAVRPSGITTHFTQNPASAAPPYPILSVRAEPSSDGGGSVVADRPASTDQVMLSQLQSNYQVSNDGSVVPLTAQDQLSRYVEQL